MRFNEHLLVEDATTDFYETCAMLGVIAPKPLAKKCEDIVYNYKKANIGVMMNSTFMSVQALAGKSGYDWNTKGVEMIKKINITEQPKEALNVFALLIGMYAFRAEIVETDIGGGKLHFIHNRIKEYYDTEKEVFGEVHGAKANTADAIISNAKPDKVFAAMKKGPNFMDDSESYVELGDGVKIFQVSLKKREKEAQLGKITTFLKGLGYGINTAAAVQIAEDYDYESMLSNVILTEGIWDKAKGFAENLWKNVTAAIKKVTYKFYKKWAGLFSKKKIPKNYLNQLLLNLGNPQLQEKKMTQVTADHIEAIAKKPKKIITLINKEIKNLENSIIKKGSVYINVKKLAPKNFFKGDVNSGVFTLVSNYCTVLALKDMVNDEKDIGVTVNRLVAEMLFGGTKLPLWKVFGDYGDGNTYAHLGTIDAFVQGSKAVSNVEVLGIGIKPLVDYYSIVVGMLEHIDETGKQYAVLRTGTNSSSSFTFIFEGTKLKKIPLEDSIAKVVITKDKK